MVVKMMRWPPWPPLLSKKFEVIIVLRRIQGLDLGKEFESGKRLTVEMKWKGGQKSIALGPLRRSVKRNFTKESEVGDDGVVYWDEEFRSLCNFSGPKEGLFYPWELTFTVFTVVNQGLKSRTTALGTASLNLAEYASATEQKELDFNIPINVPGCTSEYSPSLTVALSLLEQRAAQELSETVVQGSTPPFFLSPRRSEASSTDKDEFSALKAGLRKVKTFKEYVSAKKVKKTRSEEEGSDGRSSVKSEDAAYHYPFDTDSLDDDGDGDGESEESKLDLGVRNSVSYETLALANCARGSFYSNANINGGEDECWIYYSNRKSDSDCLHIEKSSSIVSGQILQQQGSKLKILPWKKRKLSFRSPKAKGEPLLKKHYGEEGGDDIDFDRRQLSSSDESFGWHKTEDGSMTNRSSVSEFGGDGFAVGSWESKEVASRDGHMKLEAQVFFASIDQRSERAAGESACTALVAVIADWLQSNQDELPIKSEFDSLIRDGSSEWRNLCEKESYIERFPDKHFDLETILQAKIRPLGIVPEKSFIGFFHPEGLEEEGEFDFLHGAMSFDSIWDEISHSASDFQSNDNQSSLVYIVSWNDHFFVLKVDHDAYYIIDTLGERLYEGCNQAYVLKFDKDTIIRKLPDDTQASDEQAVIQKGQLSNSKETKAEETVIVNQNESQNNDREEVVVCKGKESCKEYIKSFLAAIPIRELQVDLKKGLSIRIHHRLQIEFHYTKLKLLQQPVAECSMKEVTAETTPALEMEMAVAIA